MKEMKLEVTGMSCGHCVAAVRSALAGVDGVEVRSVEIGAGAVSYDPERVSPDAIVEAVRDEGYEARVVEIA